jgi:hypothetical protein
MRIIFFIFMMIAAESQAPWFATWKLNPAKSTVNDESRFKRVTSKIEPAADGIRVLYDMVGVRGGITHMEWTGRFDGKDYPIQGVDYVLTNAYSPVNDRSYQIVVKVDGSVVATSTVVVSPDGKTLTTTTLEKNARGETVTSTSVYDRQ